MIGTGVGNRNLAQGFGDPSTALAHR